MADQRDAWSEDISDRMRELERTARRGRLLTGVLTVVDFFQLLKDDDLPLVLRTTLLVGLILTAAGLGVLKWLERRFPPQTPTK